MTSSLASLHSLPPELIDHILTLASTSTAPPDYPVTARRRWRTLNSLSLVCSDWRTTAQRLLLQDGSIRLHHGKNLDPLLDLVVGVEKQGITQHLRSLDLTIWGEEQPDRLVEMLKLCEGLEELVVEHFDRVRFDQVVGAPPHLRSFSARQCTFISSNPFSSSPYPALTVYPHLRNLDLRLNSFRRESLPTTSASLPALNNLLFFTGSQDQSEKTVRRFLQAVVPQIKALSLDKIAWDTLFPSPDHVDDSTPFDLDSFRNLTTLGMYWDAAYLSIVGSTFLVPSPTITFSPPPYIHFSLYPTSINSLLSTFTSLFQYSSSKSDQWIGRKLHHFRFEQTFRQLELEDDVALDEEEDGDESEGDEARPTTGGAEGEAGRSRREERDPNARLLRRFVETLEKVEVSCSVDDTETRGTQERGFKTSFWRFVRSVEREEI